MGACIILKFSTFGIFVGVCASLTVGGLFGLQIAASISFAISALNLISTLDSKKVGALLSILHMNFNNLLILNYSSNFIFVFVMIFINVGLPIGFNFIVEGAGLCGIIVSKTNLLFFMLVILNSIILVSLFIVMTRVYFLKSFYYDFTFNEIQVVCFSLFIIILLV